MIQSRSTWACELKCHIEFTDEKLLSHAPRERVSWNVWNYLCFGDFYSHAPRERVSWNPQNTESGWLRWDVTLHVSVWVEMIDAVISLPENMVTLHVSVWVEIKSFEYIDRDESHAPRERVSWNYMLLRHSFRHTVTLHVSVWVEILSFLFYVRFLLSRSTWACELKCVTPTAWIYVAVSRSTWACELKLSKKSAISSKTSHAPRERVSWNDFDNSLRAVFLWSRSTWACELKSNECSYQG